MADIPCGICRIHADVAAGDRYEIGREPCWLLRHHPDPAPLLGWLLLDARRHLPGPLAFDPEEASSWGGAVQRASQLLQRLSGCDRVYAIAFGEGAPHLHLHLIPRRAGDPASEAWSVADLYRAVAAGHQPAVEPGSVQAFVRQARAQWAGLASGS